MPIRASYDLSEASQGAMVMPVHCLYRKRLGHHINAPLLDADESCLSALFCLRSELTDTERIKTEYKGIQGALEPSREQLRDRKQDNRGGRRALARNCKTYTSVVSKARKVAKVTGDDLLGTGLFRERLG